MYIYIKSSIVALSFVTILSACKQATEEQNTTQNNNQQSQTAQVVSAPSGACDPGEQIVKFSFVTAASGHPKGEAATAIANRINREMNGKLCMQLFPKSELFNDSQVMQALLTGEVQIAAPSLAKFEDYTKKYRIFEFPFLFNSMDAVNKFSNGAKGQELLNAIENQGFTGLAYIYNGLKHFSANKALKKPSDAQGLKFRVQTSEVGVAMIDAIGGTALKMPLRDVYASLQTSTVNGQENTWSNIYSNRFHEVQDGVTETNHQLLTYLAVTSSKWLNSLPLDVRGEFIRIFKEEALNANAKASRINQENKDKIIEAGGIVRSLSAAERAEWVKVMKPVWTKFTNDVGTDVLDAAIQAGQ